MLKTELFETTLDEMSLSRSMLVIDLPKATINLDVKFDGKAISKHGLPKIGTTSAHALIAIWEDDLIHAELLTTKYNPKLPSGMEIAYGWACLWRVRPKRNLSSLVFECFIEPKQAILDWDIENGEGLVSKSVFFGDESIYLGTEDDDYLYQRAEANGDLPRRYVEEKLIDCEFHKLVEPTERGVKVRLPPLHSGEIAQVQFVVAGGPDRNANWWVMDPRSKDILLQAGI